MHLQISSIVVGGLALLGLNGLGAATDQIAPGGNSRNFFKHEATGVSLEFITNSGICETTTGVNQYSGYLNVGSNESLWFWFFESRNSPEQAPLATWFNGGPGGSSMVGLFTENGPCQFYNGSSTPSINPYSWNEYANMLYIDQPFGVGLSELQSNADAVYSTVEAAPVVWKFLQAFYACFPQYENRDLGLFTESYGGHYGPEFASYFKAQNQAIATGSITAEPIPIIALGINNGWIDGGIVLRSEIEFGHSNEYRDIITDEQYATYIDALNHECLPALEANCTAISGNNTECLAVFDICYATIYAPIIANADFDSYDIREPLDDPFPPSTYQAYLRDPAVMAAIGTNKSYVEMNETVYLDFVSTGDFVRSYLPALSQLVQSGIQVLIWAGDADWICNWYGGLMTVNSIDFDGAAVFNATEVSNYTVNGVVGGTFKTSENLSWLRAFGAGHKAPYYAPELALQVFVQTMKKQAIFST